MTITLRDLREDDLDEIFRWESDPGAVKMAAFTRAAAHNLASNKVLIRNGFMRIGEEISWADGVAGDVLEYIYRLD